MRAPASEASRKFFSITPFRLAENALQSTGGGEKLVTITSTSFFTFVFAKFANFV